MANSSNPDTRSVWAYFQPSLAGRRCGWSKKTKPSSLDGGPMFASAYMGHPSRTKTVVGRSNPQELADLT
jgi:hypothetical protein